ncbi:hypothetical protein MmiHf6_00360 [Methanimicrococcus hongohii]|uniref:Uncharacterized protein n=1 Tax=Methanimicrococcus hongohii TaxID=3028295 RepID=A0AA96UY44_9EURY|nr:hypothetical protein [Methanimicrococcus sp. Hf6]WNY22751.1 hypothetical protein MmiHf6_00360 [Methanimicrococcus sp. Hf6]
MISDSKYALLPFSELPEQYREMSESRAAEKGEIEAAEKLLEKAVAVYNEKRTDEFVTFMAENPASDWAQTDLFIELERYYRQYIPFLNEKGDRCLWINLFCRPVGDWKTHRVYVEGGGVCFFSVGLNLDTGKRFDFIVNDKK